jgi:CRP/FNR family transcriptional regulator
VSQQELADSVGSVREVVARILAELRAEHLVRTAAGQVEVIDPIRLSHQLWSRTRDESHRP